MSLKPTFLLVITSLLYSHQGNSAANPSQPSQAEVVTRALELMEEYQVSYAYGGHRLGSGDECAACNACLEKNKPQPADRFKVCASCNRCSLDCSHFTQLVFKQSGLFAPYLTTKTMLNLTSTKLRSHYRLVDIGRRVDQAQPGDLLVYRGHVVMLTAKHAHGRGDIVHATGGKDIRAPGQGIQRERYVPLESFRGTLLRILRHEQLHYNGIAARLRPVQKN